MRHQYDARLAPVQRTGLLAAPRGEAAASALIVGLLASGLLATLPFGGPWPLAAAAALYLTATGVALAALPAHHPHDRFGVANHVTQLRLAGTAVFAALAAEPGILGDAGAWAALAAALALLSLDGVDGWFARRQQLGSAFGARFDMEVDALLILALAALAWGLNETGPWILGLGLLRYGFVAAGWLWPPLAAPLPPSFRRKTVCVIQVAVLTILLAPVVMPPFSGTLAALAFAALVWSFAVDIRWLIARRPPGPGR